MGGIKQDPAFTKLEMDATAVEAAVDENGNIEAEAVEVHMSAEEEEPGMVESLATKFGETVMTSVVASVSSAVAEDIERQKRDGDIEVTPQQNLILSTAETVLATLTGPLSDSLGWAAGFVGATASVLMWVIRWWITM